MAIVVEQRLRHCRGCQKQTIHYKNSRQMSWVVHLVLTIFTAGLWLLLWIGFVCLHMVLKPLTSLTSSWACSECGVPSRAKLGLFGLMLVGILLVVFVLVLRMPLDLSDHSETAAPGSPHSIPPPAPPMIENPRSLCSHTLEEWKSALKEEVEKKYRAHAIRFGMQDDEAYIQLGVKTHTDICWRALKDELEAKCIICTPEARDRLVEKDLLKLK